MKRLLKLFHWRALVRYWHRRAQRAEAEVGALKRQLAAERWRNMQREDTFASAAVLGSRNMWGLAPRSGPAMQQPHAQPQQPATIDPYSLSGADLMEFETFWKPDAEAAGVPINEAKRRFIQEVVVPRRMPLNDDPFGVQ